MVEYDLVRGEDDVAQILDLQRINHRYAVDAATGQSQGYTTVQHDPETLSAMNRRYPSVVARSEGKVVGYCLMMEQEFRDRIPVLMPMFRMLDTLDWREQPLAGNPRWFVMGQVCVAEAYRAMGVFDGMNHHLRQRYADRFDMTITEVSSANPRSLRAHRRVGFETMHVYEDPEADEVWEVVIWDWR